MLKNLTDKPIEIGFAKVVGINNTKNDLPYKMLQKTANEYKIKYSGIPIGKVPKIEFARNLFKTVGLDPTKHRPSSEALLRRAIKEKPLPKINPAVDIGNWCSLDFLLPICVYDSNKILGEITLRLGKPNEKYLAINNREINLENRYVLSDKQGAFGSPITDSIRSMVSFDSTDVLLVIYYHKNIPENEKIRMLETFIERTLKHLGGKLIFKEIV